MQKVIAAEEFARRLANESRLKNKALSQLAELKRLQTDLQASKKERLSLAVAKSTLEDEIRGMTVNLSKLGRQNLEPLSDEPEPSQLQDDPFTTPEVPLPHSRHGRT